MMTYAPSADLCPDQDPDHQDHDDDNDDDNDDDADDADKYDEGGTCLGKYSKGTLLVLKRVADVLFSQAIPETIAIIQMLSSIIIKWQYDDIVSRTE